MSNKEIRDFSETLNKGLQLAEQRMLQDKAMRGEDVIICDKDNNILRIPARQIISHKAVPN